MSVYTRNKIKLRSLIIILCTALLLSPPSAIFALPLSLSLAYGGRGRCSASPYREGIARRQTPRRLLPRGMQLPFPVPLPTRNESFLHARGLLLPPLFVGVRFWADRDPKIWGVRGDLASPPAVFLAPSHREGPPVEAPWGTVRCRWSQRSSEGPPHLLRRLQLWSLRPNSKGSIFPHFAPVPSLFF